MYLHGFLPQSRYMEVSDPKLPISRNVSMNSCLSVCVSPVIDCRPVQSVTGEIGFSLPTILYSISGVVSGWITPEITPHNSMICACVFHLCPFGNESPWRKMKQTN